MATVFGIVRSGVQAVSGLRAVAYEEVQYGIDLDDGKPCRLGNPVTRLVGEDTTDTAGGYRITFDRSLPFEDACAFVARAYVRLYDGALFLRASPKRTLLPALRFDFELGPTTPPADPDDGDDAAISGTLTFCGRPAAGFGVVAFEISRVGIEDPEFHPPCRISQPLTRNLGSVMVGPDGRYRIPFTPRRQTEFECFFSSQVRINVFTPGQVWLSALRPVTDSIRFDAEILPGCTPTSGIIRVLDPAGLPTRDAEVFVNGAARGRTNPIGLLVVNDLAAGDRVAARLLVHENETGRDAHDTDSDRDWNYRVYLTSVPVNHDMDGDNVELPLVEVMDPSMIQDVRLSRSNVLVGFNLVVSVEWDATAAELLYLRHRLLQASQLLYNATDGQFCIERLEIADNGALWGDADMRVYANNDQPSNSSLGGVSGDGHPIRMNPGDALYPGVWFHELGHYAFNVDDEYEADGWDPDNGPTRCTLRSTDTTGPFMEGADKDACLMRGAQFGAVKKFCSAHPDNPHVGGTAQGDEDCWSEILDRYGDARWRLKTPVNRGAIPARLPDSGEPFVLSTFSPPGVTDPGSFIPVAAWQPLWHVRSAARPGECPNLIARTAFGGSPVNQIRVSLITAAGRHLYQGMTRNGHTYPDGLTIGPGETRVRGAHAGDRLVAFRYFGGGFCIAGSAEITSCAGPVVIPLIAGTCNTLDFSFLNLSGLTNLTGLGDLSGLGPRESAPPVTVRLDNAAEPVTLRRNLTGFGNLSGFAAPRGLAAPRGDHDLEFAATLFDETGRPFDLAIEAAVRAVPPDAPLRAFSADGALLLRLPPGALPSPSQVSIEAVLTEPQPPLAEDDLLVAGPYRLDSTIGASLHRPGRLVFDLRASAVAPLYGGDPPAGLELLAYDPDAGDWRPLRGAAQSDPPLFIAAIDRLGVFALVRR